MTDYRSCQLRIDNARGRAGRVLGPPCNVFRCQPGAAINYLDAANQIGTNVRIARRKNTRKDDIEAPEMGSIFYNMMMDASTYLTGDVFVEADPYYGAGGTIANFSTLQFEAYCLAYHAPFKRTVAVRLDRTATIYRASQFPDSSGYFDNMLVNSMQSMTPLVLVNGVWSFGASTATPSAVPIGMSAQPRLRSLLFKEIPDSTSDVVYFVYVPALNGVTLVEGDRIVTDGTIETTESRYVVQHPYIQQAGLQGSQLLCKREVSPG